ncbi:TPA: HAD family phosphatase [Candidatus Dependentiae bacterium]|nr:MAG: Haloacid dehalogenase superfamily, subfamily IA, variant 3 with third motif having DD or ED [candidate division TM6 bacterium GW2011_GWE2_31_21]KKP53152.1 MAG: Haloacid dehalogenase superfamily, subfamily IA, variant 3 with third motif having DD or ED [candidate division TM6 bacterium GW2011_GWF2_33_332]HBS47971.1 HAD family phosphatase [Candidatus Dependentiae bacterium]HBZ73425.1 HAD family phosphatase [Candidatus Dependentiae bacterium]
MINLQITPANKPHIKYRNIIFDLGKVLIQWNPEKFITDMLKINKINEDESRNIFKAFGTKNWSDYDRGTTTQQELAKLYTSKKEKQYFLDFLEMLPSYLQPIEQGVNWLNLAQTKGYKVYLLSNYPKDLYEKAASQYEFFNRIDGAVISYQVNKIKPEPEIYQTLLSKYDLKAEESIFIDDLEENIRAGKLLGIDGIVCNDHNIVEKKLKELSIF